jgi:excisionase family DNA binding protein
VHALIEEVLVDVNSSQGELLLTIPWKGDVHTELRLPRSRRGHCSTRTPHELIEAIRVLARTSTDYIIASVLNRNGHLTGRGNRWIRERVIALRSHNRISCYEPDYQQPWVNITEAAAYLNISSRTLRLAIDRGEIPADHPFADGPWVISRASLDTMSAQALRSRAHTRPYKAAVLHSEEHLSLFSST